MSVAARSRSPWLTFALVAGAGIMGTLNYSIMFVAFPELQATFHAEATDISWAITAFSITVASLTVPGGWLADRFGRKRVFLLGLSTFVVGSTCVALAPSLPLLVAARMIQASGLALESPAAQAIVLEVFPPEQRSTAYGAFGALGGIFSAIGPAVGGALIDSVGWRWTFASSIPVALVTLVIGAIYLPESVPAGPTRRRPDLIGAAMLMVGVATLALGIVQADDWGYVDERVGAALLMAVVLLTTMVRRSARHPDPILDVSLWKHKNFRVGSMLGVIVSGHFGAVYLTFVVFMTDVWHLSRFRAGLAVGVVTVIAGPLTFVAGRLADRRGHARAIVPGTLMFIVAGVYFLLRLGEARHIWSVWIPGAVLYAVAVGMAHAASQSSAITAVPASKLGIGGAMTRMFNDVGNTMWVAISLAILASTDDPVAGTRGVLLTLVIVGVVGTALALQLERPARPAREVG